MATVFTEGFDKYGPVIARASGYAIQVAALLQGEWTNVSNITGSISIAAPLSEAGQSLNVGGATFGDPTIGKSLPANYGRLIGGWRWSSTLVGAAGGAGIALYDSTTLQCGVAVQGTTGHIVVGNHSGILQTSIRSVSALSVHYLEFDITIGNPGGWTVWLDGVEILSGVGVTQGSGSPTANRLVLCPTLFGSEQGVMTYDDLYLFDTTTSFNNSVLLSNPRIETQFPIGDHQTNFAEVANIIGSGYALTDSSSSPGANSLFLRQIIPNVGCTLNSVTIIPKSSSATANFKAVVYTDSSGNPNTLLSSGTQVTGCTAGTPLVGSLVTPQALTAATPYWLGFIMDTSINVLKSDTATILGEVASNTYASGAPSTAPTMTKNQPSWLIYGNCTGAVTNWQSVALNPTLGDVSQIQSATAGDEDLYIFPAPAADDITVYSVAVKGNAALVATGSRTIDLRTLSGATDSGGSVTGQSVTTSYSWYDSYFDVDPNTSAPWTVTNVANAYHGPKLAT